MCQSTEPKTVHCFEKAGLGKAPFRYVGMKGQEMRYGNAVVTIKGASGALIEVETKPGGTCDYCGTYIVNMFRVESADGKQFIVGCDCIQKTGDSGMIRLVNEDVKRMERKRRQDKKIAKENTDRDYCQTMVETGGLARFPHPDARRAANGETLKNYADWMMSGRYFGTLARVIRATVK